jgi:hypothetical protein
MGLGAFSISLTVGMCDRDILAGRRGTTPGR